MGFLFGLIGLLCFGVAGFAIVAVKSDIQIILAGVFAIAGINAWGFGSVLDLLKKHERERNATRD